MKMPQDWSAEDLHAHLQHAVELELWTIPLYLSALYSIENLDKMKPQNYPVAAKLLVSVAVQEMLHLELACNVCLALGHEPQFDRPNYSDQTKIPFIHPTEVPEKLRGYRVGIGPLDENQLKLFCVIELPEVPRETDWSDRESYDSIGELYEALKLGIDQLWDSCHVKGDYAQISVFDGYTPKLNVDVGFSQRISDKAAAFKAIDAIVEQGEGASGREVPRAFEPPKQTDAQHYHAGWFEPTLSHYQKLSIILGNISYLPPIYSYSHGEVDEQVALIEHFGELLEVLTTSFRPNSAGISDNFWPVMSQMGDKISAVWRAGGVPSFAARR